MQSSCIYSLAMPIIPSLYFLSILLLHNSLPKPTLPYPMSNILHYYYTIILPNYAAIIRKISTALILDKSPSHSLYASQPYVSISNKIQSRRFFLSFPSNSSTLQQTIDFTICMPFPTLIYPVLHVPFLYVHTTLNINISSN